MSYEERKPLIQNIQKIRQRKLITLLNFDRPSIPTLPGLNTQFHAELKECLFRVLKESVKDKENIDIFLYTRGGDTNSVWPLVNLIREFDQNFEILIPFRAHSAGTLFSLGAKKIIMTKLAELSPIDPSTGNQFNPIDELNPGNRLGISVEDTNSFRDFIKESFKKLQNDKDELSEDTFITPMFKALIERVHPLALGNVQRVHNMIKNLAKKLLDLHNNDSKDIDKIIEQLTVVPCSHLHMFCREEAKKILGKNKIIFSDESLENALDDLLKRYEDDFHLRDPLYISRLMKEDEQEKEFHFVGGIVESELWGYKFSTKGKIKQFSKFPNNVNVQLPPGQKLPIIPGLPREFNIEIFDQKWKRNTVQEGVTDV